MKYNIAIGIYKIPPLWDREDYTNHEIDTNIIEINFIDIFNEHSSRITSITDNIYLKMFEQIIIEYNINESYYIFVDETINCSKKFIHNNVNIIIVNTLSNLLNYNFGDLYFVRGNYLNFYNYLISKKSFIYFYPATSLKFQYSTEDKILKKGNIVKKSNLIKSYKLIPHDFYNRIDVAFVHEDEIYNNIFKKSKTIELLKPFSNKFTLLKLERTIDFIFVADAVQKTKNHECAFNFIKYCDECELEIVFYYISNDDILGKNIENYINPKKLKFVKLVFENNLSPDKLNRLYNKAIINILFSGRDACPRTISESSICGCYNIALDTLSDGKGYYDNILGKLVGNNNGNIKIQSSHSISYLDDNILWTKILFLLNKHYDHEKISYLANEKYKSYYSKENKPSNNQKIY
jgi:hypothetical protein